MGDLGFGFFSGLRCRNELGLRGFRECVAVSRFEEVPIGRGMSRGVLASLDLGLWGKLALSGVSILFRGLNSYLYYFGGFLSIITV